MGRFCSIWKPHALEYDAATDTSFDVVGNTEGRTTYYEHETGTDQVKGGTVTAITANIASGDFDISQRRAQVLQDSQQVLQILEEMVSFNEDKKIYTRLYISNR